MNPGRGLDPRPSAPAQSYQHRTALSAKSTTPCSRVEYSTLLYLQLSGTGRHLLALLGTGNVLSAGNSRFALLFSRSIGPVKALVVHNCVTLALVQDIRNYAILGVR
jgi:hypothetical protein